MRVPIHFGILEGHADMASLCKPLQKLDAQAHALCDQLVRRGETLKSLDQGVTRLDYSNKTPQRVLHGKGDGDLSPQEIYSRFLEKVEGEEDRRVKKYSKNLKKTPKFKSRYLKWMKKLGKTEVPWVFEDLDKATSEDAKLFRLSLKKIKDIKKELKDKGYKLGAGKYNQEMATKLYEFITTSQKKGGLGIGFDKNANRQTNNLGGIYKEGGATCLEFVRLFLALGRMAGLDVVPIEVFRNHNGKLLEHVRVGVRYDAGDPDKLFFLDISNGLIGEWKTDIWVELSRLDLLAYYYNTRANNASLEKMEDDYEKALSYSPFQYMVLTNYARWILWVKGPTEKALKILKKSCRTNRFYAPTFLEMKKAHLLKGNRAKAHWAHWAQKRAQKLFQGRKNN